jgi:signal transduction histidine kinase
MRWRSPLASPPVWRRLAGYALAVEADRMRTALLVTVSHDLRTPLAAAQAAVSCLRCNDIRLTAQDHDELKARPGSADGREPTSASRSPSARVTWTSRTVSAA